MEMWKLAHWANNGAQRFRKGCPVGRPFFKENFSRSCNYGKFRRGPCVGVPSNLDVRLNLAKIIEINLAEARAWIMVSKSVA
jgi:hypothetical protein